MGQDQFDRPGRPAADPPHLFGGWSQYMYIIPGSFLVRVPDDLPSEVAVLTERR